MNRNFLIPYRRKVESDLSHTPISHPNDFVQIYTLRMEDIVDAGSESAPIEVFFKNNTNFMLKDIQLLISDTDVEISPSFIPTLPPDGYIRVIITWKPRASRTFPLDATIMARAKIVKRVDSR